MGLYKRCVHKGRNRDRCGDPWWGSFRGQRVSLAKWTNREIVTKEQADAALGDVRAAIRSRTFDPKGLRPDAPTGLTFRAFSKIFLDRHVAPRLKSADTITYRMGKLNAHFGDRLLTDIKTADIEDFLATLAQPVKLGPTHKTPRARGNGTINRYRSTLVTMFNFAVRRDYLMATPFSKGTTPTTLIPQLAEPDKRDRRLSPAQEQQLLQAATAPFLKLLITTALYSGMRRGEMLALTWADLKARPGWIRLRKDTTKSAKTRWVPVHPNVQAVFEFLKLDANGDDKPDAGAVFSNEVGEAIQSFRTAWTGALRRANITNFRWHDLRHEFASRLAENGVPLVQVKDLLGHASIVTTERYVTTQPERLQTAMQTLTPPNAADVSQSLHTGPSDAATPTDPTRPSSGKTC
jgi:integrase